MDFKKLFLEKLLLNSFYSRDFSPEKVLNFCFQTYFFVGKMDFKELLFVEKQVLNSFYSRGFGPEKGA